MTWSAMYVLAGLVALILWLVRLWMGRHRVGERASRPRELAGAELVYMEKLFRITEPIRLVARVDRVYRRANGLLVLVELKTRLAARVYETDRIQLSVQKLAIEAQTGEVVEPQAFVSFASPTSRRVHSQSVTLLGVEEIVALARRREAILKGRVEPSYARSPRACSGCVFRPECDRFSVRR
jgi:CRISPR/Cas system-associated exonuclease Cas4 (RecB family)